ncbi:MAG TPA: type II toxin-antitoxin system prevent-host-death family antitoxin [Pseudonocardia sp.]|jgi:prevent-host-death family protein
MRWTATEASRSFSELLSRVAAGESIEIDRHGQVVALLTPVRPRFVSGSALLDRFANLPAADAEFADDVEGLGKTLAPFSDPWQS